MSAIARNHVAQRGTSRRPRSGVRTIVALTILILLAFVIAMWPFTSGPSAVAQENPHANHTTGRKLEPLLDGSADAESIPDRVAIRALMQTLRVPPESDATLEAHLHSMLANLRLSEGDMRTLEREFATVSVRAQTQEARIEAVRPLQESSDGAAVARYMDEQAELSSLMVNYYQQLLAELSPEGAEKLRQHLSHVKSRIKVFPMPDMSSRSE